MRRFADSSAVTIGEIRRGRPALLRAPADESERPWRVIVSGGAVRRCPA